MDVRKIKLIYVVHIIFLMDRADVEHRLLKSYFYLFIHLFTGSTQSLIPRLMKFWINHIILIEFIVPVSKNYYCS